MKALVREHKTTGNIKTLLAKAKAWVVGFVDGLLPGQRHIDTLVPVLA